MARESYFKGRKLQLDPHVWKLDSQSQAGIWGGAKQGHVFFPSTFSSFPALLRPALPHPALPLRSQRY